MQIIKTVVVKQVLTEKRKEQLMQELINEKEQLLNELEQLKFQLHKKVKKYGSSDRNANQTRESFQKEMKRREEKLRAVDFKVLQLNKLEIGTELRDGTVQAIQEIQVGDSWDYHSPNELIIKDGIIHEIRKGGQEHDKLV